MQSQINELSTTNANLVIKSAELDAAISDVNNLMGSTNIAILILDRRLHIKWFNPPTRRLLRLRASNIGFAASNLVQKLAGADLLNNGATVLRTGSMCEGAIHGADGRWYLRRTMPYRSAMHKRAGVVVIFVDIHNFRTREESLRLLAAVVRGSTDAVTLEDFKGRILTWNHGAEKMLGYTEEEALRLNVRKLVPINKRSERQLLIKQIRQGTKVTASMETQRLCKDGRIIDVWLTFSALLDDAGRPIGLATIRHDITLHKEYIRFSERQSTRLREMSAHLIATDEEERRKVAVELHDSLAQLLVVAKMKLADLRPIGSDQQELLRKACSLIGDANQAARSLSYVLCPPVLLELGLAPAVKWLGEQMKDRYNLTVILDDEHCNSSMDERTRSVLFRALRELLINVAKHAKVYRAYVRIRRHARDITVAVEDAGVGFDPKVIHEPNYNYGFGLFSIRGRLDSIGGKMKIRSIPGKKTTVTLSVPVGKYIEPAGDRS
jgi:PAS domain S-box-containing protein